MKKLSLSPSLGVIEGFYGRPWSAGARLDMINWLPGLGIQAYLYAPKADPWLRRCWRDPWPADARASIGRLARAAEASDLRFGVGLSPFGIYQHYGAAERQALRDRLMALNDLGVALVAILFDDMPGARADLAGSQAAVVADVATWTHADHLLLCPTYYSDDPVLDRVFGARPDAYLQDLCAALPRQVGIFWTGPEVCSAVISPADLPTAAVLTGHALALWDNYPVNDSKSRSEHLYLQPFSGRPVALGDVLAWHWCNAMNQPALSLPAIASLAALYGRGPTTPRQVFVEAGIDDALLAACAPLARRSREALSSDERRRLNRSAAGERRAAGELRDFLAGAYRFDPACLTD